MEQQMITQENSRTKAGKAYSTYNENVFRFTQRGASQMYVEVASVSYDLSRRFLRKFVFYGYVNKGAVQQDFSNPYAGLQQMMGGSGAGGMQIPGMGGGSGNPLQQLQDLQKCLVGNNALVDLDKLADVVDTMIIQHDYPGFEPRGSKTWIARRAAKYERQDILERARS